MSSAEGNIRQVSKTESSVDHEDRPTSTTESHSLPVFPPPTHLALTESVHSSTIRSQTSQPEPQPSPDHQMDIVKPDFQRLNALQPPVSLGLGLFPRRPISRTPLEPLTQPEPYLASPIAAPILKLATHPELSTTGTHYSQSPSMASLASIISHSTPTKPSTSKQTSSGTEDGPSGNLTNWWSAIASAFGVEGLNNTDTSTGLEESNGPSTFGVTSVAAPSSFGEAERGKSESLDHGNPLKRREASSSSRASTGTMFSSWWTIGTSTQTTNETVQLESVSKDDSQTEEPLTTPRPQDNGRWRSFKKPRHPLVLCHGLFGFDLIGPEALPSLRISYWKGVKEALEEQGVEVLVARVPASASIEERARILAQFIEEKLPGREVNLIGHSMGGLDSRFLITHLKPTSFKVVSLTTIATPHRGSSFADYIVLDLVGRKNLPKLLALTKRLGIPGGGKAFEELTLEKMARFNAETPDEGSVAYFSYGAAFQPGFTDLFRLPWGVIYDREGPNDGMVSVSSATWGKYRGTLENVNHMDLVGWTGRLRYAFAEWTGKKIAFEPVSFFLEVAESLADEGL